MEAKEQPYRRNLLVLLVLQSLSTTAAVVLATVNGLAGLSIAPDRSLATIPTTAFVLGGAISTYFASLFMARFGRRAGFRMGALWAIAGAGICAYAMHHHRFWLLCFGSLVFGTHNAFAQYHRFAAAEAVSAPLRSRAISWVLAGGVVGAVLGPESAKLSKGLTSTVCFPLGNLCPEGSVIKATSIDPSVVDSDGVYRKTGRARVFTSERDAIAAIKRRTGFQPVPPLAERVDHTGAS